MAEKGNALATLLETKDYTAQLNSVDIASNKVMGIVSYIGILVLIPILFAKDSAFARFHANQGLVLLLIGWVGSIVFNLLSGIKLIGWLFALLGGLFGICGLALMIVGIINVVQGKAKDLPLIGSIRILQ